MKETTLRIEPGTTVALVGATGAGKSTIAKLVARFYDVSAGQVRIDDVDVRQLAAAQLRREVLMLTQEVFCSPRRFWRISAWVTHRPPMSR